LLKSRSQGRQRYYRLASDTVAQAVEGLLPIAPLRPVTSLKGSKRGEAIRYARTCYDHLAGRLGVALADALEQGGAIRPTDSGWDLTGTGERQLEQLGVDIGALSRGRRRLLRSCLDWTERRPHLAGALGAALATRLIELEWIERLPDTRAVRVTPTGQSWLKKMFALELA
jgi:hypothetical protein